VQTSIQSDQADAYLGACARAVLELALAAGDQTEATRRYAALFLRHNTPDALLTERGTKLFAEPGSPARQTMAEILAGAERWNRIFPRRGAKVLPPGAFVEILENSITLGARYRCADIAIATRGLAQRDPDAARRLTQAGTDCQRP